MRVLSLFSGIGAFEKALSRIGINYELINYCEIDKHASKSYSQIHNIDEDLNLWDVTTIDSSKLPKNIDLLTHGSPCQDFSLAGKQAGGDKNSGTRSSLMYETVRIVEDIKPKIIIWENVKNVLSKKHKHNFDAYIESLNELGYNSYYQVLNAKEFGIPQNRERVFIVSIRKDIDDGNFKFPNGFPLKLRFIDLLDDEVDEKYYVTSKRLDIIQKNLGDIFKDNFVIGSSQKNAFVGDETICPSLTSAMGTGGGQIPMIKTIKIPQTVKVRKYEVDTNKLCEVLRNHKTKLKLTNKYIAEKLDVPLTKVEHWFRQDKCFAIPNENIWLELKAMLGIKTNEFDESIMTFEERDGVYEKSERHYFSDGIAPTLTSTSAGNEKIILNDLTTRNLTPKECWRLMGFDDEDCEKAAKVNSNTQLYKQAGNSIVVNVLENIFEKLRIYFEA